MRILTKDYGITGVALDNDNSQDMIRISIKMSKDRGGPPIGLTCGDHSGLIGPLVVG
jgi:hypothetical protein